MGRTAVWICLVWFLTHRLPIHTHGLGKSGSRIWTQRQESRFTYTSLVTHLRGIWGFGQNSWRHRQKKLLHLDVLKMLTMLSSLCSNFPRIWQKESKTKSQLESSFFVVSVGPVPHLLDPKVSGRLRQKPRYPKSRYPGIQCLGSGKGHALNNFVDYASSFNHSQIYKGSGHRNSRMKPTFTSARQHIL